MMQGDFGVIAGEVLFIVRQRRSEIGLAPNACH